MKQKIDTRRKPVAVKERQGTLEKSRANMNAPASVPPSELPECPENFNAKQEAHWRAILTFLEIHGLLSAADLPKIEELVTLYGVILEAKGQIIRAKKMHFIDEGKNSKNTDYKAVTPYWAIYRQALTMYNAMSLEFGLSPIARERIELKNNKGKDDELFD